MRFMYLWSRQYCRQVDFQHEFRITSSSTVVEWKNFMRDVCLQHFIMNPVVIGGVGHTVELIECMRVRGNYHRGHRIRHPRWIFGAIDIETTEGLVIPVADCEAATLLPLIRQHILPGSTVMSDMWVALNDLQEFGYAHMAVDHMLNFVDPVTHAATHHIKSVWQKAKHTQRRRFGTPRQLLSTYLAELMWRRKFPEMAFQQLLIDIRQQYPLSGTL